MPIIDLFAASRRILRRLLGPSRRIALAAALVPLGAVGTTAAKAAPTVSLPTPFPEVPFSIRVTDIERIPGDAEGDAFRVEFELLNWTSYYTDVLTIGTNIGTTALDGSAPRIVGASIDPDGRGGSSGGNDIGPGSFDPVAIHNGRGRGDLESLENNWHVKSLSSTFVQWDDFDGNHFTGTTIPYRDIMRPFNGASLVPGFGVDALGDSAIDGGPRPYLPATPGGGRPNPDGSGNVLDGFVVDIDDWDVDETFSVNWFLAGYRGQSGGICDLMICVSPAGTAARGNAFGFGVMNLVRVDPSIGSPAGTLAGAVFVGNTGFDQSNFSFYDTVYEIPNPAEFAAEFGAAITAPFLNPADNIFNAPINTHLIVPEPGSAGLVFGCVVGVAAASGRGRRRPSAI